MTPLLCAALFICEKLGIKTPDDPKEFLESLVVANVGKFSKAGKSNSDYAGQEKLFRPSIPFIEKDLKLLTPDVLVFPRTIYNHPSIITLIKMTVPKAQIIPVYQFNPQVVNTALSKHDTRAKEMALSMHGSLIDQWTHKLKGYGTGLPYRYFVNIESQFANQKINY